MNAIDPAHLRTAHAAIGDYLKFVNDADNPIPGDIYHRMRNALEQHADGKSYAATNAEYCLGYVHAARAMNVRMPAIEAANRAAEIVSRVVLRANMFSDRPIDSNL